MSKTEKRKALSAKLTETIFFYDPYNGADEEDVTACNNKQLKTLEGCYEIIEELCNLLYEEVRA